MIQISSDTTIPKIHLPAKETVEIQNTPFPEDMVELSQESNLPSPQSQCDWEGEREGSASPAAADEPATTNLVAGTKRKRDIPATGDSAVEKWRRSFDDERQRRKSREIEQAGGTAARKPSDDANSEDQREESEDRRETSEARSSTPSKNEDGLLVCTHSAPYPNCRELTFERPSDWRKHMDKHERPFRCLEAACAELKGFTYQGGLLRHEREVHGKDGGPREILHCPIPYCKRHAGPGFSRRENLNEHVRRLHRPATAAVAEVAVAATGVERINMTMNKKSSEDSTKRVRRASTASTVPATPKEYAPIQKNPATPKIKRSSTIVVKMPPQAETGSPFPAAASPITGARLVDSPRPAYVDTVTGVVDAMRDPARLADEVRHLRAVNARQAEELARLYGKVGRLEEAVRSLATPTRGVFEGRMEYGAI